jgi:hypothetical protein
MRVQHLGRALGSDHRATTDPDMNFEAPPTDGDVSTAWAVAFVVIVVLGLLSPFL